VDSDSSSCRFSPTANPCPRRTKPSHTRWHWSDRLLLRHRAIIETIIDQLKNISQIEHSRHRSVSNFFVNGLCGLIAYCRRPSKPSLGLDELLSLPA